MSFPGNRFLHIVLFVLVGLTIATYYHRYPTGDDAWIAEESYWLSKNGIVRSEFFRGILGWEKQLLVSHKLFIAIGAVLIKLFGHQLPTVQLTGLLFFCLLVFTVTSYIRKREYSYNSPYLLAILILIFSNRFLIRTSFENRPDMVVAALGFSSFLCLIASRHKLRNAAFGGLLAGLALLSHLNGVIYLLAGVGLLVYQRTFKAAVLFSIIAGCTSMTYFIDVLMADNGIAVWLSQFKSDPATQNAFTITSKLLVMATYPRLFFYTPEHAALSILFVYIVWHQRKILNTIPADLKIYSLLLFISFWILTKSPSGSYLTLFIPFMLLIIYELYRKKPFTSLGLKFVLILYMVIGLYGTIEIIYTNNSQEYIPVAYKKLRSHLSSTERGLVPLTFFFNEYEQYAYLLCHENFTYFSNRPGDLGPWANDRKVDFILMDYVYRPEPYYPPAGTKQLPFYNLSFFDGRFAIYKHQPSTSGK